MKSFPREPAQGGTHHHPAVADQPAADRRGIRDEWQNIGSFLFKHLVTIAKRNNIGGFSAEVLRENKRMQAIFLHCGFTVKSSVEEDVYTFQIDF